MYYSKYHPKVLTHHVAPSRTQLPQKLSFSAFDGPFLLLYRKKTLLKTAQVSRTQLI